MLSLRPSLFEQLVWAALATSYNIASLVALNQGEQGFAGDAGTTSSAMVSVVLFTLVTMLGLFDKLTLYRILAPIILVLLLLGGVLKHALADAENYASQTLWFTAIAINTFGVAAYAWGVIAAFRVRTNGPQ